MKKLIKIKLLVVLIIFFNMQYLFSKKLINEKYSNLVNEWRYDIENNPDYFYSESLIIDDCKNNYCRYNILTTASGGYDCQVSGNLKIINDKLAIADVYDDFNNEVKSECKYKFVLSDDYTKLKIVSDDDNCWIADNTCSLHGYILENYEKIYESNRKTYKTSFKCENLNLMSDVYICIDKELAALDLELNKLYKIILKQYKNLNENKKIQELKKSQWKWLKLVQDNDPLKDIKELYTDRILELKKLIK